jgi:hypothetical protein
MFPPSLDSAAMDICQDIPVRRPRLFFSHTHSSILSQALNAVASLLVYDRDASPDQAFDRERQPACMTRMSPPPLRGIMTRDDPCFCLPEGPPPRQASNLPPAGTLRLELTLGDKLGSGAGGLVYAVVHAASLTPTGAKAPHRFPPLVVKVCYGDRGRTLLHETSAYDEMECIQGVVVPRCFGYFEVETTDRTVPMLCQDVRRHLAKTPPATCEDEEEDDYLEDQPDRDFSRILCVLLLEQHGGTIDLLPEQWSGVNVEESAVWYVARYACFSVI